MNFMIKEIVNNDIIISIKYNNILPNRKYVGEKK